VLAANASHRFLASSHSAESPKSLAFWQKKRARRGPNLYPRARKKTSRLVAAGMFGDSGLRHKPYSLWRRTDALPLVVLPADKNILEEGDRSKSSVSFRSRNRPKNKLL